MNNLIGIIVLWHNCKIIKSNQLGMSQDVSKCNGSGTCFEESGMYEYLLTGEKKVLNLRTFSERDKVTMYNRQQGLCAICGKPFSMKEMHADHIKPWSKGGLTELSNGQMLCVNCNLAKSDK